jgi:hypothetical protein
MVVGSFLPWLYSGTRARNSYATGGVVRRLLGVGDFGDAALRAWPFIGALCGLAVAALLLGARPVAAALGLLAVAGAATAAITMLSAHRGEVVRPAYVGPIVTLVGAFAVLAAITIQVISDRSSRSDR